MTPATGASSGEATPPETVTGDETEADVGGDPACWAHRVCQACGRLNEAERPVVCEECGEPFED